MTHSCDSEKCTKQKKDLSEMLEVMKGAVMKKMGARAVILTVIVVGQDPEDEDDHMLVQQIADGDMSLFEIVSASSEITNAGLHLLKGIHNE